MCSLEKRRPRGDLIVVYNFFREGSGRAGADPSLLASSRTQRNRMKLHQGKFRLDTGKSLFTERVDSHWNNLPKEVVRSPSPSEFKECLDEALSHMV